MPNLVIDTEFTKFLPAQSDDELKQLEENLASDGRAIAPLIYAVLDGKDVVIDGMTRFPILQRLQLPFTTECMSNVTTRDEAELWIYNHALGQRNLLKPASIRKVRGNLYNKMKGQRGGDKKSPSKVAKDQSEPLISDADDNTAQAIGERTGVSESTVKRDGKFAAALGKLPEALAKAIETGSIKATEAAVIKLASCDKGSQKAVWDDVRMGREPTIQASLTKRGLLKKREPKEDKPDTEPAPAKSGKPPKKFDRSAYLKEWDKAIGPLVRLVDKIAKGVGESKCEYHKTVQEHLNIATDEMHEWMKGKK